MLSLEQTCLTSIVKNFRKLFFAFKEQNDKTLKRNFEFLQRRYSFQLFSKLYEEWLLEDEYVEFLMNEHLNYLHGCWIMDYDFQTLPDNSFFSLTENVLCRLPNLTRIFFPLDCCDEDVENIAKFCPKLVEIDVSESRVTDHGIKYLCKDKNGKSPCPELKKLCIENTSITYDGIEHIIQNIPSLEELDCCRVTPLVLHSLHKEDYFKHKQVHVYNLTSLDFSEVLHLPYCRDILEICLTACPKLKSIENCYIYDEQQLYLFNNPYLQELDLHFLETHPKMNLGILLKNNGSNITSLAIRRCNVSISDLLVCCPKLNCLRMWYSSFTDDDLEPIISCLAKGSLKIRIDVNTMLSILLSLQNPEYLEFDDCFSPDEKIRILKLCERNPIKKIDFRKTNTDVNLLHSFLSCSSPFKTFTIGSV